jgi:arginine utilization regulatory protein
MDVFAAWDRQEEWLQAILATIDEGIHVVDTDGVTIVYNEAAGRLDGLSPQDVIGKHVLSVFPSLGEDGSTLMQVLRTGRPIYNRPQTYTNFRGLKVHTVNTSLPIVVSGRVVGALEVAKDLTQVKRLADQVLSLQAQVAGGSRRKRTQATASADQRAVYRFSQILTEDQKLLEVLERARLAARTSSPILIYGETGTGKELLVQAIHNASSRVSAPFLAVNCAALPGTLLEGILFGTVRGSFTGAEDRAGLFELCDGGTLFLDEIQSMPLDLQAKLLRVLQEGELMRVGDTRLHTVDVRLMAAMNQSPEWALAEGTLRPDLYYRINVVRLDLPPLRDRTADLPLLVRHFVDKYNGRFGTCVEGVSAAAMQLLQRYPWPGNVRELENAIEAAMNWTSSGWIGPETLPAPIRNWRPGEGVSAESSAGASGSSISAGPVGVDATTLGPTTEWVDALVRAGMDELWQEMGHVQTHSSVTWPQLAAAFERLILRRALTATSGNVTRAAKYLGIPRQTLQYRIRQLRVDG